jgi:exosortase
LVFGLAIAWASWPTFADLARRWSADPQTSHGVVVPVLAVAVLLFRRKMIAFGPGAWWSVPFFVAGAVFRVLEARYFFPWFGPFSLVPTLAGVTLVAGGWPLLRWAWPGLTMLLLMLPLPFTVEACLSWPLQKTATGAATYILQTLGQPAYAEGNVIYIDEHQIGVLEACNGLGMLVAFFSLSTAMAIVINRPWIDRLVVFLSAIPIAVVMNLVRVSAIGFAHVTLGSRVANGIFHDVAGWLMMPSALLALWLELKLYDRLFPPIPPTTAKARGSEVRGRKSEIRGQKSEVGIPG